ncbi:MAG: Na+/H+ antiporter NhaC family protein [Acidobacteriota bacterium]
MPPLHRPVVVLLGLGLAAALILGPLAAPSHAVGAATVEVEPNMVVAGTPLAFQTKVAGLGSGQSLLAQVILDGAVVATVKLPPGASEHSLDAVRPGSGEHTLTLKAGGLSAHADFSLMPGWVSILPPLIAIALALIFRDVLIALFVGIFGGAWLLVTNPFTALGRTIDTYVVPAIADTDHVSILVFTSLLGAMVGLITKSGGTHGIVELLLPYATSRRRGQFATWAMGLLIFFDDYANTLIVGPTMRPITDRLKISREKLAYIVDSTAAPVVCLFPISTWVGFEIGLIADAFTSLGLQLDPYGTFVQTIPYRFYPIFALTMVLMIALGGVDFGPMRRAERRARTTGRLLDEGAQPIADYSNAEVEPPADAPKRAANALLPILTVIVMVVLGLWITGRAGVAAAPADAGFLDRLRAVLIEADSYKALLWASLAGMLVAFVLPVTQRILKVREAIEALVAGIKAMFLAFLVLIFAWSLSSVCDDLDTAQYLVGIAQQSLAPWMMPTLTFVLAAAVAFATGSSWGTLGILSPLVIPIAHELCLGAGFELGSPAYSSVLFATIASVLTGSVWGDHCSPISDTTILSSMATGCDHIAHVRTQLPYAMTIGLMSIAFGSLPAARGISPWLCLGVGITLIVGTILAHRHFKGTDESHDEPAAEGSSSLGLPFH